MTKKHFIKIASKIKPLMESGEVDYWKGREMIDALCDTFKDINPNFNQATFKKACAYDSLHNALDSLKV